MLVKVEKVPITNDIPTDPDIEAHIRLNTYELNQKMAQIIGHYGCEVEGRFERLRAEEANVANMISDLVRTHFDSDLALVHAGSLRSNQVVSAGEITVRTIQDLIPMPDKLILLKVRGDIIK